MRNCGEGLWRHIPVLRDHLRAREAVISQMVTCTTLKAAPDGYRTCSPHRHKSNESDTVKGNRAGVVERTFPVPIVDLSGEVTMWDPLRAPPTTTATPHACTTT